MEVVLVNSAPDVPGINEATVEPPLGLAYIGAVLEENRITCKIIDAYAQKLDSACVIHMIPVCTKVMGFYLNSFNYSAVCQTCSLCRKGFPDATIVVGGPLASVVPEQILRDIPCDGVIRGEGEYAVLEIVKNIREGCKPFSSNVSGAVYLSLDKKNVIINPIKRIEDLDRVPFPAYHLLPPLGVYKSRARKRPIAAIITSRGCSQQCIFCSKDVFQRKVTFRSAENVLAEIDYMVSQYGIRQIDIMDDNFTFRRSRVEEILDGLIERNYGLAVNLQTGIRVENLDEILLTKMKLAGIYKLAFGIESADMNVLAICRKSLDLQRAETIIKLAKAKGFIVYGFFIIGLPGENDESFSKTVEFARRMDFDIANFTIAIPFVGTELYSMICSQGKFLVDTTRNIEAGFYGSCAFYELKGLKQADVLKRYKTAYKEFYSLGKKLRLVSTIRSWSEARWYFDAFCSVVKNFKYQKIKEKGAKKIKY